MEETEAEIAELRASFRAVLEGASSDIRRHVDQGDAVCEPLLRKAAELGWFSLLTPESHGGLGLGRASAAALYEEIGRAAAPLPILGALVATEIIAAHGDEALKRAWLPRLAAGETASITAGGVAPDWNSARFAAGKLTGEARGLLDGANAALVVAPALESNARRWVLAASSDATVETEGLVDRTRNLARAQFDGADGVTLEGDADIVARDKFTHASLAIACDSVGGAKAVLDLTVAYLKTREQFGKPIGSFQALKHRCAEHKVAIEAADALVREAVGRWADEEADAELFAALAKALACDVYATMATDAVQLHGGIGFTWEHVCHLYLKRAKLNQALFGGSAAHRDRAAHLLAA